MIRDNILRVRERIFTVCSRLNLDVSQIVIVAVSKGRDIEQIGQAIDAGITDIGENRVQEAAAKYRNQRSVKWHLVGHLQTNKVKEALKVFDLIHSVDSLHLAEEIDRQAERINKVQDILLEVKTSEEPTKFGLKPEETIEVIKKISGFKNINIKGLMTIAPAVSNPKEARPYFRKLRELREEMLNLRLMTCDLPLLSMGMTDDFEIALEEGANMLRLGRVIFD
jgi:pyridoxal phosphate enzyme (YggS family)